MDSSTATSNDVQPRTPGIDTPERTPIRCGKRQRADTADADGSNAAPAKAASVVTEVIEINDSGSDSDTDSIIANVETEPCPTCAREEADGLINVSYDKCCMSCDEYLCSSNGPCVFLKRKECSVDACKQPICTDCVAGDGRCVDCAGCACCGQSDDTPKITCVDCGTQYCVDTCECECNDD